MIQNFSIDMVERNYVRIEWRIWILQNFIVSIVRRQLNSK